MARLKVSLVRSLIGQTQKQRDTVKGLGLRKRQDVVVVEDTAATRGMVGKVSHLVTVETVED
jgi:large subunit ribosomal protein L30